MLMEKQHLQESLLSEKMGKKQNENKETEKGRYQPTGQKHPKAGGVRGANVGRTGKYGTSRLDTM